MIIDGDNGLHRAYHKYGGFATMDGKPSSVIFGFPYMVRSMITKIKPDKVYCTFDGGSSVHRKAILPGYKDREQRLDFDKENFYSQKEIARQLMMDLAITVVWEIGVEADDLIYRLVRKHKKDTCIIVSGDKDFHQLINDKVSVFSPHKEIELTPKNLHRYYPYHPHEVVDYLVLTGDKSDKVPGYGGIGEKRARQFLDAHTSIKNYLKTYTPAFKYDPIKMAEVYRVNRTVVDLAYFYRKHLRKTPIPILNPDPVLKLAAVAKVAREYQVTTLTKAEFLKTFKDLANENHNH